MAKYIWQKAIKNINVFTIIFASSVEDKGSDGASSDGLSWDRSGPCSFIGSASVEDKGSAGSNLDGSSWDSSASVEDKGSDGSSLDGSSWEGSGSCSSRIEWMVNSLSSDS